jgi:phage terminase small subunit
VAKKKNLSVRMRKFAAVYDGNGAAAAELAGYKGSRATLAQQAYRLLRDPDIRALIDAREEGSFARLTLSRVERQELWSEIAADPEANTKDRLKASELLGKSEGDFTERLEVKGELTLEALVLAAHKGRKK